MKKRIFIFLVISIFLTGCTKNTDTRKTCDAIGTARVKNTAVCSVAPGNTDKNENETEEKTTAKIPNKMQPCTIIVYEDCEKYKILKGGEVEEESSAPSKETLTEEYPTPFKGMKVIYGSDGMISEILDSAGQDVMEQEYYKKLQNNESEDADAVRSTKTGSTDTKNTAENQTVKDILDTVINRIKKVEYLSMTVTKTIAPEKFLSETYCYDLKEGTLSKVNEVPYSSKYPFTTYDRLENCVYYTAADDKGTDQLYLYDLDDCSTEKITDDFFFINYVFIRGDDLLLIGCKRGNHSISPYIINKKDKSEISLEWDKDFLTWIGAYNPYSDRFFISGYSDAEDRKVALKRGATNYIYEFEGTKRKKILEEKKRCISTFTMNRDKIIYKSKKTWWSQRKNISVKVFDFSTKKTETLKNVDELVDAIEYIYWTDDNRTLYYTKYDGKDYKLCKYDFETNTSTEIYSTEGEQAINNIQVYNR